MKTISTNDFLLLYTVSDRCSSGETVDKSGQVLHDLVTKFLSPASIARVLIPDDVNKIEVCDMLQQNENETLFLFLF